MHHNVAKSIQLRAGNSEPSKNACITNDIGTPTPTTTATTSTMNITSVVGTTSTITIRTTATMISVGFC